MMKKKSIIFNIFQKQTKSNRKNELFSVCFFPPHAEYCQNVAIWWTGVKWINSRPWSPDWYPDIIKRMYYVLKEVKSKIACKMQTTSLMSTVFVFQFCISTLSFVSNIVTPAFIFFIWKNIYLITLDNVTFN